MSELVAVNEPYNEENACWSKSNCVGYDIPVDSEDLNMLTNQNWNTEDRLRCMFTISELEVWAVTF